MCGCASEHNKEQFLQKENVSVVIGNAGKNKIAKILNEVGNLNIELQDFQKPVIRVVQGLTFKVIEELEDFIEFIPPD